jgi:hypothetical protein
MLGIMPEDIIVRDGGMGGRQRGGLELRKIRWGKCKGLSFLGFGSSVSWGTDL